ncbi:MAG: glycosyltransferase, partial [Lachnospiraceae bacterium]|nr:glycosyltransferase [Lachnospiraceae bacterium]
MSRLYIVIPAYNERDNIENVVNDWYPVALKYGTDSRLVVVNDGSKDD